MLRKPQIDIRDTGFTNLPSLKEAIKLVTKNLVLNEIESINLRDLSDCSIKILAEDIYAKTFVPNFTRATMDGFAVKSNDVRSATLSHQIKLQVIEELSIGKSSSIKIQIGQAIKIPTGGVLPDGTDSVIKIEDVQIEKKGELYDIIVNQPIESGKNISKKGEDFKKGELIFSKERLLTPVDIGVVLSVGVSTVKCYKAPKIGVLSTGDEIVDVDRELNSGEVYDTNSFVLQQYLRQLGFTAKRYKIIHDDYDSIKRKIIDIITENDIILTTGGTSVGKKDFVPLILNELSNVVVHGISIKPGSPTTLGFHEKKLFIGLPGFPVSSLLSFAFFGIPIILFQMGSKNVGFLKVKAHLSTDYLSAKGRTDFLRVSLRNEENKLIAIPINVAGSSLLNTLSTSDGIVVIDDNCDKIFANSLVDVVIIDRLVNNL